MKEKINSTLQSDISALERSKSAIAGADLTFVSDASSAHHDMHKKMISSAVIDIERELQALGDSTEGRAKEADLQRETNIARARGLALAVTPRASLGKNDVAMPRKPAKKDAGNSSASSQELFPIEKAAEAVLQAQNRLRASILDAKWKRYQLRLVREAWACWDEVLDAAALQRHILDETTKGIERAGVVAHQI